MAPEVRGVIARGKGEPVTIETVVVPDPGLVTAASLAPARLAQLQDFVVPGGRGVGYSRFDFIDPRSIRFTTTFSF